MAKGIMLLQLVFAASFGAVESADRCTQYDGASALYKESEDKNIPLVKWSCSSCNCCDTEDMHNTSWNGGGRTCETMQVFWFDPALINQGSRYRCDANERASMDSRGFDVQKCSDPSYEHYGTACCCVGCSEPIEVVHPLLASNSAGLGKGPSTRTDVCQCGPEILALAQGRRLSSSDESKIYQKRHVGENVGRGGSLGGGVTAGSHMCLPVLSSFSFFLLVIL